MNNNIVAVIQARMGASRLPNKEMLFLNGHPVCEWVARRVAWAKKLDKIVFAVPDTEIDHVLSDFLLSKNVSVYIGSEEDVLRRTFEAAESENADLVVRVCADNPFIDGNEIDNLIDFHLNNSFDYSYNHIPKNNKYPDGLGAEILSFDLLKKINKKASLQTQREHSMNYIWDNKNIFSIGTFDPPDPRLWHPEIRLDLDNYADYKRYLHLGVDVDVTSLELIELLTQETRNENS